MIAYNTYEYQIIMFYTWNYYVIWQLYLNKKRTDNKIVLNHTKIIFNINFLNI